MRPKYLIRNRRYKRMVRFGIRWDPRGEEIMIAGRRSNHFYLEEIGFAFGLSVKGANRIIQWGNSRLRVEWVGVSREDFEEGIEKLKEIWLVDPVRSFRRLTR